MKNRQIRKYFDEGLIDKLETGHFTVDFLVQHGIARPTPYDIIVVYSPIGRKLFSNKNEHLRSKNSPIDTEAMIDFFYEQGAYDQCITSIIGNRYPTLVACFSAQDLKEFEVMMGLCIELPVAMDYMHIIEYDPGYGRKYTYAPGMSTTTKPDYAYEWFPKTEEMPELTFARMPGFNTGI